MHIIEIEHSLTLPAPKTPRSAGVHLSSIIRSIAGVTGILKPEYCEDLSLTDIREINDPVAVLRICIGLAWEEFYIPQLPGVVDHPGELCYEGVYMTHDGESVDVIVTLRGLKVMDLVCHEVKATYKSTKTVGDMTTQWMWLTQIKGYCKGLGTRFARIHVLFLCGDYTFPITPKLKVWQIEFTQEEIDQTWDDLIEYRNARLLEDARNGE